MDSGSACGAGGLCDSDSSTRILRRGGDNRNVGGAVWQLHIVGVEVGVEASNGGSVDLNIRQACVVGRCGNKLNLIGGGTATVSSFHLNNHRIAINGTLLHDLKLIVGESASRERDGGSTCVGD